MGRYYSGDIEGKFWFAIQSSDDADYFGVEGVSNFGAISLTQIPGDPDSIIGNKARGVFWTKPDSSGKEEIRDEKINEAAYSEFIDEYKNTYFKEVFDVLSSKYKLGRVRILLKQLHPLYVRLLNLLAL